MTVLAGGVIDITYGAQANSKISGCILDIVPYTNANNDVLWRCGLATAPANATASTATNGTNVSPQYLPTSCHA